MRKITLLLSLCAAFFVGATQTWAQWSDQCILRVGPAVSSVDEIKDGGYYVLWNAGRSASMYEQETNHTVGLSVGTTYANITGMTNKSHHVVKVAKTTDGNYTFQFKSGNYMPVIDKTNPTTSTEAAEFTIEAFTTPAGSTTTRFSIANAAVSGGNTSIYFNGNASGETAFLGWDDKGDYNSDKNGNANNGAYEFYPVDLGDESLAASATKNQNIVNGLGGVTGYTQEAYDASGLATAKTTEEFEAAFAKLEDENQPIAIEEGRYYRLVNHGCMVDVGTNASRVSVLASDKKKVDQIWQFVSSGNGYHVLSANSGKYIPTGGSGANGLYPQLTNTVPTGYFSIEGIDGAPGYVYIRSSVKATNGNSQQDLFFFNSSTSQLGYWNSPTGVDSYNAWRIVPATDLDVAMNAVDSKSYATVHLPFGTKTTGDVKAYYATAKDDANVTMTETTDGIAANQGALLVSESGATTATLTIADGIEAPTDNLLKGTNVALSDITAADYYIFGNGDAGVGFYHPSATTLKANRAYIEAGTTAAASLKLNFGQTTGIESIVNPATDAAAAPLYDLQGRRVVKAAKGIYIQGGKKVYVK